MSPTEPFLPEHMRGGMKLYLEHGVEPGGFMYSVLANDLKGAVSRADHINLRYLTNIVSYCYNSIPSTAWGSYEKVDLWLEKFRQKESSNDPQDQD
jgi:hypothetical protein